LIGLLEVFCASATACAQTRSWRGNTRRSSERSPSAARRPREERLHWVGAVLARAIRFRFRVEAALSSVLLPLRNSEYLDLGRRRLPLPASVATKQKPGPHASRMPRTFLCGTPPRHRSVT